jgi:hypothetical protein
MKYFRNTEGQKKRIINIFIKDIFREGSRIHDLLRESQEKRLQCFGCTKTMHGARITR